MSRVLGHGVGPWKHHVGPVTIQSPVITNTLGGTIDPDADVVPLDSTAANIQQGLPSATGSGRCITFENRDETANTVTLNASGSDEIFDAGNPAGAASFVVAAGAAVTLCDTGSGRWQVVSAA